mmetsp:Transcript_5915/g.13172  ORF Transcript_5915/g.13172 Transcript_5915/m.13172 type:complete len:149 (-) Transcript_5915:81-527(-)
MDANGNSVAITSSVNTYFGSGVLSKSTGILLNSQLDDFATPGRANYFGLEPAKSNYIRPGKKPLSSMSPLLIFKNQGAGAGEFCMSLGASGGPKIISAALQVLFDRAVGRQFLFDSVASPRLHDQLLYHESASALFERAQPDKYLQMK